MRFLEWAKDGGPESPVMGFFLIEVKWLFSIVLLRFSPGSRDAYHSHAFNALTWFLKGKVIEFFANGFSRPWGPSLWPKWTPRDCVHKVGSVETTWALSVRGPWARTWFELRGPMKKRVDLGHGRKELST
jgi:hypothetical protein